MSTGSAIKFTPAAALAVAALSLPTIVLAQPACPGPGGADPGAVCVNTIDQNYSEAFPTTMSGTYINEPTGQVTANANKNTSGSITALKVDKVDNKGTVNAHGSGSGSGTAFVDGIRVSNGFTNSGILNSYGYGYGVGLSSGYGVGIRSNNGDFTNSGTVNAYGYGYDESCGYGISISDGDFANSGTVNAFGYGSGSGNSYSSGISINGGGFTNSGTINTFGSANGSDSGSGIYVDGGFTNSGTVYSNGYGSGSGSGYGIWVSGGNFTNSGTVNVYGSGSGSGYGSGIWVSNGGFINNNGTVNAYGSGFGSGDGDGIYVRNGGFTNRGTVNAYGYGSGSGIWVSGSDFTNNGTVNAYGSVYGYGYGVYISGNFTNSGELTLISSGGTALYFGGLSRTFTAQSGSSLIVGSSNPAMVFSNTGTLSINSNAGLTVLGTSAIDNGSKTFVVAQNVSDTGASTFYRPDSAVFSYEQKWTGSGAAGNYEVTVTREDWASNLTGGEGGDFVSDLEDFFKDNGAGDASGESWLDLLDDINSGDTGSEVKRRGQDAARLNTAQATGQSLRLIQDASRRAGSIFIEELSEKMRAGTAPAAGGGDSSASVWFSPYYITANQDSSDRSLSSVDGDWWGFTLGAAYSPQDNLNFGLGFHFLKGELDSGRSYETDSTAWGLDLGFAANLGSGRYRPLLTGTISHTRHDFDQTRRVDGYAYKSSPNVKVTYAALGLSQDFHPAGDAFIIRPKIGFDWTRTDMDSYTERGPGLRALKVDSENYDSYRSEVGAALAYKPSEALELELRAAWLHDFGDRSPILTSVARDVAGLDLYTPRSDNKRDSAALGASASFEAASGLSFGLDYDGQFNSDLDSHQIWGSLKYSF